MKRRALAVSLLVVLAYGCATGRKAPEPIPQSMQGIASWYGEEFAGRTTANGEIFDPLLLTAAHRTLPFGTVLDITNPTTKQSVRVRVNDRGPYIGNRVIDLSYAAAKEIGLVEPGVGPVEIAVVRIGSGEREPPKPLEVTLNAPPAVTAAPPPSSDPPEVPFPLPSSGAVVDRVVVEEQRGGVAQRRQVAADGRTVISVPTSEDVAPSAATLDAQRRPAPAPRPSAKKGHFVVQVGAFSVEQNARSLQQRLQTIGQRAWIDQQELFRVRIGPFATRDEALQTRSALEAEGMSAIIVAE